MIAEGLITTGKTVPATKEDRILAVLRAAEREAEWLARHPRVPEPYRGQWVVVHNHRVVAGSPDGSEVAKRATARDYPGALLEYIPTLEEREAVFVI